MLRTYNIAASPALFLSQFLLFIIRYFVPNFECSELTIESIFPEYKALKESLIWESPESDESEIEESESSADDDSEELSPGAEAMLFYCNTQLLKENRAALKAHRERVAALEALRNGQ